MAPAGDREWLFSPFSCPPSSFFNSCLVEEVHNRLLCINRLSSIFLHQGSDCHATSQMFFLMPGNMKNVLYDYVYIPRKQDYYVSVFYISGFSCIKSQNQLHYSQKIPKQQQQQQQTHKNT